MEKTYRHNGQDILVAVVIHNKYGGWFYDEPAFFGNPKLIKLLEEQFRDIDAINEIFKNDFPNVLIDKKIISSLKVQWIRKDTKFRIKEYDGLETIEFHDKIKWIIA